MCWLWDIPKNFHLYRIDFGTDQWFWQLTIQFTFSYIFFYYALETFQTTSCKLSLMFIWYIAVVLKVSWFCARKTNFPGLTFSRKCHYPKAKSAMFQMIQIKYNPYISGQQNIYTPYIWGLNNVTDSTSWLIIARALLLDTEFWSSPINKGIVRA